MCWIPKGWICIGYIESKLYLFILQLTVILFYFIFAFTQALTELEHLNLGYNCLQRAPTLGLSARAKLVTLILRNNELETINGKNDCYLSQASRTLLKAQLTFSAKRPNSDEAGRWGSSMKIYKLYRHFFVGSFTSSHRDIFNKGKNMRI